MEIRHIKQPLNDMEIKIDPEFKELIPPLTDEEYAALEDSLTKEGCREPVIIWDGIIIDGHNRYELCEKHGIPYETSEKGFPDRQSAVVWMIDNQMGRRNLSAVDRILLAQKRAETLSIAARRNQQAGGVVDLIIHIPQRYAKFPK